MPRNLSAVEKTKIKKWLKDKGHKSEEVDALALETDEDYRSAICRLHGVDIAWYRQVTQSRSGARGT